MKCKRCGAPLSANTLDRCPRCSPESEVQPFTKIGKALHLGYFLLVNLLIILSVIFLIQLLIEALASR